MVEIVMQITSKYRIIIQFFFAADCPDIDVIEQNACEDKWSEEKCKEKTTNGEDEEKCRKNNIKKNCQKTCGHCQ